MNKIVISNTMAEPVELGSEPYLSENYAKAESDKLWRKVWQTACRVEEIPDVGDYVTYDVMNDSIVLTRSGPDEISAFYNVCAHRGKRLANGCGHTKQFRCSFHAWRYDLKGENTFVLDQEDWEGALKQERLNLPVVKVDTWGGWVWINMDPDCEPLRDYLEPAAGALDPYEMEHMRYRWRMWTHFDCNWKVGLEAFMEPYHVEGTHPQMLKYADFYVWSQAMGLHGNDGFVEREAGAGDGSVMRAGKGSDARVNLAKMMEETWATMWGSTTETLVKAAMRLPEELPEGTPTEKVVEHWITSAKADDAARGVTWPEISQEHMLKTGLAWHVFPNMSILIGQTFAQVVRLRPVGTDPNKCIFEIMIMDRFPEGEAPGADWVHADAVTELEKWPPILQQDFANIVDVQRGMKSKGFRGVMPNPRQERKISNFHRNLANYMGTGAPRALE